MVAPRQKIRNLWKRFRRTRVGSESGQGILEYVLLLAIIVILILGLAYQFNTAFRTWAEGFFDGYIACLLETGELPGTSAQCAEEWANFNYEDGTRFADGSFGGGGGEGANQNNTSRNQSTASGGGGGEVLAAGPRSRVGFARLGDRERPTSVTEGTVGDTDGPDTSFQLGPQSTRVGRMSRDDRRRGSVSMVYYIDVDEDNEKNARPSAAKVGKAEDGAAEVLRPGRAVEKGGQQRTISSESSGPSFSIGRLLRLLLIICIIIAMFVFFGGQLLQIAKSREKGGD